jgi:hypothetical protein
MSTIYEFIASISLIKIFLTLFAVFAWSRAILRFRDKAINFKELMFWSLVWAFTIIVVFIPGKATVFAKLLGVGRGFDAMVFIAIIALFYAVYRLYVRSNEAEQEMTRLIREISLKINVSEPKKDSEEK